MTKKSGFYGVAIMAPIVLLAIATAVPDWYVDKLVVEELPAWALRPHRSPSTQTILRWVDDELIKRGVVHSTTSRWITTYRGHGWIKEHMVAVTIAEPFQPIAEANHMMDGGSNAGPAYACAEQPRDSVKIGGKWYVAADRPITDCQWLETHPREVIRAVYGH